MRQLMSEDVRPPRTQARAHDHRRTRTREHDDRALQACDPVTGGDEEKGMGRLGSSDLEHSTAEKMYMQTTSFYNFK